jgi:hypothetical protein
LNFTLPSNMYKLLVLLSKIADNTK